MKKTELSLSVSEIKAATTLLLQLSQLRSFHSEITGLQKHPPQPIQKSNHLLALKPALWADGLLHVGGRLTNAAITDEQKYPIILSPKDPLTRLIFQSQHVNLCHAGPTLLFSNIGAEYYVSGARQLARSVCKQCVSCQTIAARAEQQLMGQLPEDRVKGGETFITVGVDYAGPFDLKTDHPRSRTTYKAYLAVFVCFASKGVHLEIVKGLTTEAFLSTLKRFMGRRGPPINIYSDNGGNFRGAKKDLEELYRFLESTKVNSVINSHLLDNRITWHTIPERVPHFGGLWEAAVKSAKYHLKRVMGSQHLTYEEFHTVVVQVEACLNSRPLLEELCHSTDGTEALTAAHLLIGRGLLSYPETEIDLRVAMSERWTLCQQLVQSFWKRWSKEYLCQLQKTRKWQSTKPILSIGDVVLMKDASSFMTHWGLARVVDTHPGDDGLVRDVDVKVCKVPVPEKTGIQPSPIEKYKVKTSILTRPVTKLISADGRSLPSGGGCSGHTPSQVAADSPE